MSGKAKRHRGKQQLPGKKKKSRYGRQVIASQPKAATPVDKPAAPSEVVASPAAPSPAPAVVKNPGLPVELRRVGILFGMALATLITLALLLD
ncbi:MAG: hypothetical protein KAI14_02775 [Dehalococcoidales bacterium]|nr:hypothetical protein [Dehalococcoidales bacterium]